MKETPPASSATTTTKPRHHVHRGEDGVSEPSSLECESVLDRFGRCAAVNPAASWGEFLTIVVDEVGARCRAGVVVPVDVVTDSEVRFMVGAECPAGAMAIGGELPPEVEPGCGPGVVGGAVVGGDVADGVAAPQGVSELDSVTYPAGGAPSGPWASGRFAPMSRRCSVHPSPAW